MGTSYKGGSPTYRSVGENIDATAAKYEYQNGRFGKCSPSTGTHTRNIISDDPLETARDFYDKIAYGGIETKYPEQGRSTTQMADGTMISFRIISKSDGSPVVEINIKKSNNSNGLKEQKIHFIKEEDD